MSYLASGLVRQHQSVIETIKVVAIVLAILSVALFVAMLIKRRQINQELKEYQNRDRQLYISDPIFYQSILEYRRNQGKWPNAFIPANRQLAPILEQAYQHTGSFPTFEQAAVLNTAWKRKVFAQFGEKTSDILFSIYTPDAIAEMRILMKERSKLSHLLVALLTNDSGISLLAIFHGQRDAERINQIGMKGPGGNEPVFTMGEYEALCEQALKYQQTQMQTLLLNETKRSIPG